jgi:carboxypeptidase family protein/pectate lyase-like protein
MSLRTRTRFHSLILVVACLFTASSTTAQTKVTQHRADAPRDASTTISLADFAPVGDGVADDSPALQQALELLAKAGGGTLLVPAGHYALRTPVSAQFAADVNINVVGEPSTTPIIVAGNGIGLDLTSEFVIAVGEEKVAVSLSNLNSFLMTDVSFVGVQEVASDAKIVLQLNSIAHAEVRHCEFYGLAALGAGGAIILAQNSDLHLKETALLGCDTNSGLTTSLVQNISWIGIQIEDCKFIDYGNRPDFFSKTPMQSPYSWINIGAAKSAEPSSSTREAIVNHVFLDEGGYFAVSARPDLGGSANIAPFDVYLSQLNVNVNNLASDGVMIVGAKRVFIDRSHFGWSHNAGYAVNLIGVEEAILDLIDCSDDASRFAVDAQRVAVINSNNSELNSTAPFTRTITTKAEQDPAQFVRAKYLEVVARDPDASGHYYWSDQLVRCDEDGRCLKDVKAALVQFLNQAPQSRFVVQGHVADQDGNAITSATVTVSGAQSVTMTSDGNGDFVFSDLPTAGSYTVTASKVHFAFQSANVVTPIADQQMSLFGKLDHYSLSGRVFSNTGATLSGATLTLSGAADEVLTSDDEGNFSFTDLPAGGDYLVSVERSNYVFNVSSRSYATLSNDEYLVFEGVPLQVILAGKISDSSGSPLNGIKVSLSGTQTGTRFTNATGEYSFTVLADGNYTLVPIDPHFSFNPTSASFNNPTVDQTANFVCTKDVHSIGGRVFANTGRVLPGASVLLSGDVDTTAISDSNGDFLFSGLPAGGDYTVTVSRTNYNFGLDTRSFSDLTADQYISFEGVLRNYTVSGHMQTSAGAAIKGATVILTGGINATKLTDPNGNYSFTVPADENYTVRPSVLNYEFTPASINFNMLSANVTAVFTGELIDFVISGQVVTEEAQPLGKVTISVTGEAKDSAIATRDSGYSLKLEAEGDYVITPLKANYTFTPASISIDNLAANQQFNFTAKLNPGVPLVIASADPTRALAFDAVLHTVEPFNLNYEIPWSNNTRTRVMLFVKHFQLAPNEPASNISVIAEDADHRLYPLTVEWVGKVDGSDLIYVIARLSDDLTDIGDVAVRITHVGLTSEPLLLSIGHSGGGPPLEKPLQAFTPRP